MKPCKHCGSMDRYNSHNREFGECRDCAKTRRKTDYKTNKEKILKKSKIRNAKPEEKLKKRNSSLKRIYGITLDEFNVILSKQNNKCAICYTSSPDELDHCHITKINRGILCHKCNKMLGLANDNSTILKSAIDYLGKNSGN